MKYLKTYENYKFKIGDYVRHEDRIYKIISINDNDPNQPYNVQPLHNKNITYASTGQGFELIHNYEVNAMKYNI